MKNCVLLEEGIAYDGGKMIPWAIFYDAIQQLASNEVVEKLKKNKRKFVSFQSIDRGQSVKLSEEMILLGVRHIEGEKIEVTRKRLMNRIKYLNRTVRC